MDMPIIDVSREELNRVDLLPFHTAIKAGTMGIMTAHINVPALDPDAWSTLSMKVP